MSTLGLMAVLVVANHSKIQPPVLRVLAPQDKAMTAEMRLALQVPITLAAVVVRVPPEEMPLLVLLALAAQG